MKARTNGDTGTMLPGLVEERKRMFAERARKKASGTQAEALRRVTNSSMPAAEGGYTCPDLVAPSVRPGADDALQVPSRYGNRLHYRDGRKVEL